jgi:hypothetical protein
MKKFLNLWVALGIACFFAGRLSVSQKIAATGSEKVPVIVTNIIVERISSPAPAQDVKSSPAMATVAGNWDKKRWNDLLYQPGDRARNAELAALLENLGATDPDKALALAAGQGNLLLREQLTQAALHGWARTSPTNAAAWALSLADAAKRETALSTVFAGVVAADPNAALRLGTQIIAQNPDEATGYGSRLIDSLIDAGKFQAAAQWALSGDSQNQSSWMAEAYSRWAEFQPAQAAQAAANISDSAERNLALHGIVGGWAQANPADLIQFVTQLPAEADRDSLLSQSLERWVKEDPTTAAQWINQSAGSPALDQGIAAVATTESLSPGVAVTWADGISNPQLRSETLVSVLRNWLTLDPSAAENYFNSAADLLPDDRQQIAEVIAARNGQTPTP